MHWAQKARLLSFLKLREVILLVHKICGNYHESIFYSKTLKM
ncbi:hypothetical protein LEP1GSC158_4365 [Leptospira interrogans serovar Zanoni str. LT2156]|uniref:Uncharacterized protein n=1 Tax=Leptospira interrogans serovar Zanoni str. LT2156 TaxID=1001601 RepID=M6HD06_LEPIR|nr:hypothetical protein LEP1GSC158_4365 [Leptospira interrogans serovar Zanoni str. LT2156]